ncbi:hypothetical protein SAMN05216281_13211 [Cryobacterium luteum]|nr:hypothetical protein SAMN05216281_13211 [Cryobacterium luteum]
MTLCSVGLPTVIYTVVRRGESLALYWTVLAANRGIDPTLLEQRVRRALHIAKVSTDGLCQA